MKTLQIQIMSRKDALQDFGRAFKDIQAGKKVAAKKGVYFSSLEAVRNLLTPKRLELLNLIKEHSPKSIHALSEIAGRDFKNVYHDIMILKDYGLVKMSPAKKTSPQKVALPYQAINIHVTFQPHAGFHAIR